MSWNIQNKRVTIIGAGRSGVAAANVVVASGGRPKISEARPLSEFRFQLKELLQPEQVTVEAGGHTQAFIRDSDYVVLSPGVRKDSQPVQWAAQAGIKTMGEVEFAFRFCCCPVVAVTGSNGKTTTVSLIAEIFKKTGRRVCLCGNIGSPFSKHVLSLQPQDIVVLEISSFQLESISDFKPKVAVWTNFSQNHLDRHKDLQEYFQAKSRLFINQDETDFAVLNYAQPEHRLLAAELKAKVVFFNTPEQPAKLDNPNYLAAMRAAETLGVDRQACLEVFAGFKGVEHRLEFVRTLDGVDYINDSKSTTVEAGRWALERGHRPMIMICGGLDKHLDYSPLKPLVAQKVKHMIAIGQAKDIMKETFKDVVSVETFASLEEAILAARQQAVVGDCVLLSPMCASFDMFDDYEHRGKTFKDIINGLN